jgi:ankyrin repeat protein
LNNFDDKDQKNFLHKYWRNLNLQHKETRATSAVLKQSAEVLIKRIKSISSQSLNELIGIPLQTKMLADIYFEKVKDEKEFSQIILTNIADLYNQFIESKIKIQYKKIGIEIENDEELFEKQKEIFYANHIKLSSSILFENKNKNLDDDFKEKDEKRIMKDGIVVAFTNKTPTFLHQSFAEFFLAKSCLHKIKEQKRIKDDKELEQILREKRHFLIRKFLNDLMAIDENQKVDRKNRKKSFKKLFDFFKSFDTEIENCCRENLVSLLKYFIEDQGAQLNTSYNFLIVASRNGSKDVVAFLLEKGIDVNQTDKYDEIMWATALMYASQEGHAEVVKMLIQHKNIDINQQNENGKTALMLASERGHEDIVKMLLEKENIEINQGDKDGWTALMLASRKGHDKIVKMLLEKDNIEINQTR